MSNRRFSILLSAVLLIIAVIQVSYSLGTPFRPDEFANAYSLNRVLNEVPYRDFKPYKTVVSYYIQLPAYLIGWDHASTLYALRLFNVLICFLCLAALTRHLSFICSKEAALAGLVLIASMSTFNERIIEVRADNIGAWFSLFSLLFILDSRFRLAGVFAALSFFCSQKGAYNILALNAALGVELLMARNRQKLEAFLQLNTYLLIATFLYFAATSLYAGSLKPFSDVFLSQSHIKIAVSKLYSYGPRYWLQSMTRNPLFYLILFAYFIQQSITFIKKDERLSEAAQRLLFYSIALVALCKWHRQSWPYFIATIVPLFTVCIVFFLDYYRSLISSQKLRSAPVLCAFFATIIVLPLIRFNFFVSQNPEPQRSLFYIGENLLENNPGGYLAGMDMFFNYKQAYPPLRWLDKSRLNKIKHLGNREQQNMLQELDDRDMLFIVWNWRLMKLPQAYLDYFKNNFVPWCGNLHIYSPRVAAGPNKILLRLPGKYKVLSDSEVTIRDATYAPNTVIEHNGEEELTTEALNAFRLQFLPKSTVEFDSDRACQYQHNLNYFQYWL